jgi:hypothetical protein
MRQNLYYPGQTTNMIPVLMRNNDLVEPVKRNPKRLDCFTKQRELSGKSGINQNHVVSIPDQSRMDNPLVTT